MPSISQKIARGSSGGGGGEDITGWFNVKSDDFGASGSGSADDTTPIQNALDAAESIPGSVVYVPRGTYKVSGVVLSGSDVRLCGEGTLKLASGSNTQAVLRLSGATDCIVNGIRINGSREFSHLGLSAGLQVDGSSSRNIIANTYVEKTKYQKVGPEDGEGYNVLGDHNTFINIRAFDCGYAAVNVGGDHNVFYNPMLLNQGYTDAGLNHGVRAFANKGDYTQIYGGWIDQRGVDFDAHVEGHGCFQADPNPNQRAYMKMVGTKIFAGNAVNGDSGANCIKIALFDEIYLEGVEVYTLCDMPSMRFAENMKRIHLKGCRVDTYILKENNISPTMGEVFEAENCVVGLSSAFRPSTGFLDMNAARMLFKGNEVHANRFCGVEIEDADLEQCVFDDNHLRGYADGSSPVSNVFLTQTDSATMVIGSGKYIYLPNNRITAMGAGGNFTASTAGKRQLLSTIDRTGRNFELSAFPVDTNVSWRLRDRVYSTATPASGNPDFWICKVAGVGGTVGQWQAHNL